MLSLKWTRLIWPYDELLREHKLNITSCNGSWQSTTLSDWSRGELQSFIEWWCLTAAVRLVRGQSRVGEVTPEPDSKSEIALGWRTYNFQEFCIHEALWFHVVLVVLGTQQSVQFKSTVRKFAKLQCIQLELVPHVDFEFKVHVFGIPGQEILVDVEDSVTLSNTSSSMPSSLFLILIRIGFTCGKTRFTKSAMPPRHVSQSALAAPAPE